MRINRARLNFFLDTVIGLAFLVEVVSGFVLWAVLPHGGYQGGRNAAYQQAFVISRDAWLSLHDWFALAMVIGVLAHLVLHWKWIVCMIRRVWRDAFQAEPKQTEDQEQCPV